MEKENLREKNVCGTKVAGARDSCISSEVPPLLGSYIEAIGGLHQVTPYVIVWSLGSGEMDG